MITNTKKNFNSNPIIESRKNYYLVTDNHKIIGIATRIETARVCAGYLAKKRNAVQLDDNNYSYSDEHGQHLISIESVKRIRMSDEKE